MRQKVAFGLLVVFALTAAPVLAATAKADVPAPTQAPAPAPAAALTVDEFLSAGTVTTELVTAFRCPIQTLGCNYVNEDCGIYSGYCHCKAGGIGGGTLTCVGNPPQVRNIVE